ncbi:MAG: sugar ABC transporter permease [Candidatus Bathyarchaeia archaeon]
MPKLPKNAGTLYLMLVPAFLFYFVFRIYPIFQGIYLSLFRWSGVSPQREFIGLSNFILLFSDPQFYLAFKNTLIITIVCIIAQLSIGFILAWLSLKHSLIGRIFQSVVLLPHLTSLVIVGTIWTWIFDPSIGILNNLLGLIGLTSLKQVWLGNPGTALLSILIAMNWQGFGLYVILFIAGLKAISKSLYESARVDGLSDFQTIRYVILPMLKEVIFVGFILIVTASFKTFELIYIMTGGGPAYSTEVLAFYLYRSTFEMLKAGYGSAIANIMLVIALIITAFYIKAMRLKG